MNFRCCAAIALWTMLCGPVLSYPYLASTSQSEAAIEQPLNGDLDGDVID